MQVSGVFVGAVTGILFVKLVNNGEWASASLLVAAALHQLWLFQTAFQKSRIGETQ